MERKRRTLFAVLIAVIIVAAVFSSFAINVFFGRSPEVHLPDLSSDPNQDASGGENPAGGSLIRIEVTPETVQNVVATLSRPTSYYRQITIELWAGETSSVTTAQVWEDSGWTRSDVTAPGGMVQHNLMGDGVRYLWYGESRRYLTLEAEEAGTDLVQRIPTYEDVLALEQEQITDTGYEDYGGLSCVYVEVAQQELNSRERYWISVASGLLVAAERVKEDQVVYRMSALTMESPAPLDSNFALPDGTVLHTVGDAEG